MLVLLPLEVLDFVTPDADIFRGKVDVIVEAFATLPTLTPISVLEESLSSLVLPPRCCRRKDRSRTKDGELGYPESELRDIRVFILSLSGVVTMMLLMLLLGSSSVV